MPVSSDHLERMLDGLSRLCDQRPEDLDRRAGPLRKRALKKRDELSGPYPVQPVLERSLAMLLLTWIDGQMAFTEKPAKLGGGQNQFSFRTSDPMPV
jgi:hypothetical protein